MPSLRTLLLGLVSLPILCVASSAGSTRTKIEHADNGLNLGDHYAAAVAIDLDVAVVGVPDDDVEGSADAGHVEILVRDGGGNWSVDPVVIFPPVIQTGTRFGASVAVQGTTILVGAPGSANGGKVYAYGYDGEGGWSLDATLDTIETEFGDAFGSALVLEGDTAIIGAPRTAGGGAVYAYTRTGDTWTRQQKVIATDSDDGDQFGTAIKLNNGYLYAGAPGHEDEEGALTNTGAVYMFQLNSGLWQQNELVQASIDDQKNDAGFGKALDVEGDTLLVGAPQDDEIGFEVNRGAAYVFHYDGFDWLQQTRLVSPVASATERGSFGSSVILEEDEIIIGAPTVSAVSYGTDPSGAVYVYRYDAMTDWTWDQTLRDEPRPARYGAALGTVLALSGDSLLAGAPQDRDLGSARFYRLDEDDDWQLHAAIERPTADGGPGKGLGFSVATSGGLTAVGQPWDVTWDSDLIGSVYVYNNDRGTLRTKLLAPSWVKMPGERFFAVPQNYGTAVAMDLPGGVGVLAVSSTAGVFIYRVSETTIELEALLEVGLGANFAPFPPTLSVAVSGETVLVGQPDELSNGKEMGAVHVFVKEGSAWRRQAILRGTEERGGFGTSVTVDGNTAVVGAPANAPSEALSSAAYLYTRTGVTWTLRKKLTSPVAALDSFAQSVALKGRMLAVTVPHNPYGCRILIYDGAAATWALKQTLTGDLTGIHLGTSLGFDGATIVAGLNGPGFFYGGAVTYAQRNGLWKLQDSYRPTESTDYHAFGQASAVSGPDIAIGSAGEDSEGGADAGSLTLIHTPGSLELYDGTLSAGRRVGDDGSATLELGTRPGELVQGIHAVRYLTLYNGTARRVSNIAITADGPDSSGVFITQLQSTAIDPGQSTWFSLTVLPPDSSLDATLHIGATGQPTQDIALTGTALASAPTFELTEQPNPDNLLQEGGSLLLKVAVSAPPGAVQYRWMKDGKTVPGATGPELLVPHVKLTDAGTYEVVVLSLPVYEPGNTATLTSDPARVVVVGQPPTGNRWLLRGSRLALRLPIAGPGYEVQWWDSFGPVANVAPFSGANTPLLSIGHLREEDFQSYTPVVSLGNASPLWQGSLTLIEIQRGRPLFSVSDLGTWRVGQAGSADLNPDFPPAPGITFTATGLPPGLKLNSTTGILSGTPSREGLFVVRVTLSNRFGSTTQSFNLQVYPFTSDDIAGAHLGILDRDPTLNNELGGGVKIDVTLNGVCTGRITFGKIVTRFVCQLDDDYTGKVTLRSDDKRWEYDLRIKIGELGIIHGTITHDYTHYAPTQFSARRAERIEHLSGYYTGLVRPVVPQATDDTYPQGVAFAAVRASDDGTVVYAGRLSDGTALTATSVSDYGGQVPLHFLLYNGLGSFQGPVQILRTTDFFENDYNILSGVLSWLKKPSINPQEANYAAGIPLHDLQMLGFRYFAPLAGSIVLALDPQNDNAQITFDQGGLRNAAMDPGLIFTLTTANQVVLPLAPNNPTGLTLKLDAATGLFTGTFTLKDPNPLSPLRIVTRKANFAGVLVPRLDAGFGSFQLPQLITGAKDRARTLSGNLVLEAFETEE